MCTACDGQPTLCLSGKSDGSDCFRLWHQQYHLLPFMYLMLVIFILFHLPFIYLHVSHYFLYSYLPLMLVIFIFYLCSSLSLQCCRQDNITKNKKRLYVPGKQLTQVLSVVQRKNKYGCCTLVIATV